MAGSLPTVRGGVQALCPVTRRVEFLTDVAIGLNASEQRARKRPPLTRFVLPYTRMSATDTAAMKAFFESQKGTFDSTWSFRLGSITYANLTFEEAEFTAREEDATRTTYSFTLRARQTQNPGQTASAAGAAFPTLASGAGCMLPYQQVRRFAVLLNDNPIGMRYAYTWFGAGLAGFPPAHGDGTFSLRGWELNYPNLTDADLTTIEGHFRNQWGRWSQFSFTDPDDSTVYPKCRYDDDVLQIVNNGPNLNSLTLRIRETN